MAFWAFVGLMAAGALLILAVVASFLLVMIGFGTPVGESTYTGQVVDVEHDRGIIFPVDTVNARTGSDAGVDEMFCVVDDGLREEARQYAGDGGRVVITYHRPLWLDPRECERGSVVMTDIRPHNTTGQ